MQRCLGILVAVAGCGFQAGAGDTDAGGTDIPDGRVTGTDAAVDGRPDAAIDAAIDAPPDAPPMPVTNDHPSVADTFLASDAPNSNFNDQTSALVDGDVRRTVVMRFDLSSVPADATIQSAALHIWTDFDEGQTCTLYPLLEAWSETAATWNRRMPGVAWSNAGAGAPGSRSMTAIGTVTPLQPNTGYVIPLDVATVAGWVANPASNHGIAFVTTNANGTRFSTREHPNPQVRPFLRVTYVP